jgi:Tol biopolymer transport system component/imidazolonepropionase-like amidohydrolase
MTLRPASALVLLAVMAAAPAAAAPVAVTLSEGTNIAASPAPDRSRIVVEMQGVLWIAPFAGGAAQPITTWPLEATRPSWSPRGDLIAFQAYQGGGYHVWTVRPDGTGLTQRTFGPYDDREPAWSPDGASLAFASDRAEEGSFDIWTVDLAGGDLVRRTSAPSEGYEPAWAPDGKALAFVEDGRAVIAIDAGGARRTLATAPAGGIDGPAWRPDGWGVVYVGAGRNPDDTPNSRLMSEGRPLATGEDVFPFRPTFVSETELLYTADGGIRVRDLASGAVRAIPFTAELTLERPDWTPKKRDLSSRRPQKARGLLNPRLSPDGRSVVVGALGDLYRIAPGRAPEPLTRDGYFETDPEWSADGRAILYTSDKEGRPNVYRRDLETGAERRLTDAGPGAAFGSALSPDGRRLAYLDQDNALQLLDLATGRVRKLADAKGRELVGRPTWSPDNRHLAFNDRGQVNSRFREGYNQIRVVNADTGADRFVSPAPYESIADRGDSGPVWSPDGRWMAFILRSTLWVLPVEPDGTPTGAARPVTREAADSPSWSGDSKRLLYIHEGGLKTVALDGTDPRPVPFDLAFANDVPTGVTVIHAGRLWDGVSEAVRTDVDVVVRGDRIAEVRPHRATPEPGARYVDASDRTVLPGLIEMHNHPDDEGHAYGTRYWRMYLSMGVTSALSLGGFLNEEIAKREALASGRVLGPRLFATGELFDGSRMAHPPTRAVTSDEQLELEIARQGALDTDFFKTYVRLPAARMARVGQAARARGLASGSHFLWPGIQSGQTLTTHLSATTRTGYSPTVSPSGKSYADVTTLYAKGRFGLIHTPFVAASLVGDDPAMLDDPRVRTLFTAADVAAMRRAAARPLSAAQRAEIARTGATLAAIVRGGGSLGLGTDAPLTVPAITLQLGLRSLVQGGLTPVEALRTVTSTAARLIGADQDLGAIAPGKLADLIVVRGEPLKDIADLYRVEQVMKGGRLLTQADIAAGF